MSADADTPRGGRVLSKDRMEGFSDGVFGFAITLLAGALRRCRGVPGGAVPRGRTGADPAS